MALSAGDILGALADPTRRELLLRLEGGPLPVFEIAMGLTISRPAVSQHLKVLKEAGMVVDVARGTQRIYRLNPAAFRVAREYLDRVLDRAVGQAEAKEGEPGRLLDVVRPDLDTVD